MSGLANSVVDMETAVPVNAAPATSWDATRPDALSPQLWTETRPTVATLAMLALPDGSVVRGVDGELLGWESGNVAGQNLADLWLTCARQFPSTGLWPICDARGLEPTRGWEFLTEDGKPYWLDPYAVPNDVYDAITLADREYYFQDPDDDPDFSKELLKNCGVNDTSMTLAQAMPLPDDALTSLATPANFFAAKHLTLVACRRPADAVLLLDFGVANDDATPGIFAGVLRSWEERFGVVPVMLNPAWTSFQVLAPPNQEAEIERLAAEVVSFAEDSAAQGGLHICYGDHASPQEFARSREWLIWWD